MIKPCDPSEAHTHPMQYELILNWDNPAAMQNKDFIRELPDELLCFIVSKLELRDAVKTTVLSKRWIHIVSQLNVLAFDQSSMFPQPEDDNNPCAPAQTGTTDKFVAVVTQFLDFYRPPHIQCLGFCFRQTPDMSPLIFSPPIDGWVRFAVKQGAQSLRFRFYGVTLCSTRASKANQVRKRRYVLRSKLLDGPKNSLKELYLSGCGLELGSNFCDQFRQLRILHLKRVVLLRHDLQAVLSHLTRLESLVVHSCRVPEELSLTSSIFLKEVDITFCSRDLRKIEIHNANLSRFHCFTDREVTFNSTCFHNLKSLYCAADENGKHNVFASLPKNLPMLHRVGILIKKNIHWVKLLSRNITTFFTVTELLLFYENNVEFCFSILKAFPCLQKLIIEPGCGGNFYPVIRKASRYEHEHLKEIILRCCRPSKHTQVTILLLQHVSTLERFFMEQGCGCCDTVSSWDEGEQQKILEELQGCVPKHVSLIIR